MLNGSVSLPTLKRWRLFSALFGKVWRVGDPPRWRPTDLTGSKLHRGYLRTWCSGSSGTVAPHSDLRGQRCRSGQSTLMLGERGCQGRPIANSLLAESHLI